MDVHSLGIQEECTEKLQYRRVFVDARAESQDICYLCLGKMVILIRAFMPFMVKSERLVVFEVQVNSHVTVSWK